MIELKQVTKQYGQAAVLKNITLSIDEPGIYCLLGRNGAGKTTLLKSIAGYQNITRGTIEVDDKLITISLINTLIHLLIDPVYPARAVINMMDVCNWTENGIFIAGVQQLFFLLLVMIFLHVLLSMQSHWYGWLTDAILVAIICVFTPIAVLREILSGFFQMIMLNSNAILHIGICLSLSAALSFAGLLILKKKIL